MPTDAAEITGGLDANLEEDGALQIWLRHLSTGEEYGESALSLHRELLARLWGMRRGLPTPDLPGASEPADRMQRLALELAQRQPFVEDEPLEPIQLTDNLVEDVQRTTGLTYAQIAQIFGISERAVASWKNSGVPRHREELMRALRAIGLILVGALGAEGVAAWFRAGQPSRITQLVQGGLESVIAQARSLEYSPAT